MLLITWWKRAPNFEISKTFGKFGLNVAQMTDLNVIWDDLKMNFIRNWPWKKSSIVSHCVSHAYIRGTQMLEQSRWNTNNVTGANDCAIYQNCAISHDNCAISHSLFLCFSFFVSNWYLESSFFRNTVFFVSFF